MTKHLMPLLELPIIHVTKPVLHDTINSDGGFISGYREVYFHKRKLDGYVVVNKRSYGCNALAKFTGNYVYVEASDYWCSNIKVGGEPNQPPDKFNYFKCRRI